MIESVLSADGWPYASAPPVEPGDPGRFHALFSRDALITVRTGVLAALDAALGTGGLEAAVRQLAERSPVPVKVDVVSERFPDPVESTAYFVASEALAHVAKYAQASSATVGAERLNGHLVLVVSDDGVGGADPGAGSGLSGLADRVSALSGELTVESPAGAGTRVRVAIPLSATDG